MNNHTPAPWLVDETKALGAYGVWTDCTGELKDRQHVKICSVFDANTSLVPREQRDANAKLIAAAPDLYAALRPFANIAGDKALLSDVVNGKLPPHEYETFLAAIEAAAKAVAKVTA